MPKRFVRKRNFRRRGRKAAWYNKKYSAVSLGKLALRKIWKLKGLVNSEMHKHDVVFTGDNMTITGSLTHITGVAIGDSYSTRTGNSMYVRAVNIQGTITWNSAGGGVQMCRMMIIQDTQQVGDTAPGVFDVLDNITSVNPYSAHLNPTTVGRFRILRDYKVALDGVSSAVSKVNINLPMRHHVRFNGVNGTDIQRGGLYILLCSNKPTSNYPIFYADCRVSFHDN